MNFDLHTTYGYNKDILIIIFLIINDIIKNKTDNLGTMDMVKTNFNIILNREENRLNLHD